MGDLPPVQFMSPRYLREQDRVWDPERFCFRIVESVQAHDADTIVTFEDGDASYIEASHAIQVAVSRRLADRWTDERAESRSSWTL